MQPAIRALTVADADAVLALNEAVVHHLAPMDLERYRWFLAQATVAWAADVDGELAGFVLVLSPGLDYPSENYRWFSARYERFWYLDRVAVAARHRRRRLGSALYAAIEAAADEEGAPVLLEVNEQPPNEASLAFHTGRGYRRVGSLAHPDHKVVALMERAPGTVPGATPGRGSGG